MSKNNKDVWKTKYGPRRVRKEAPTLAEAIDAAEGLSDDLDEQTTIAASLMGMPRDEVRAELLKMAPPRKDAVKKSFAFVGSTAAPRTVVVERKLSRRVIPAADRTALKRPDGMSTDQRSGRSISRQS
jgi:hypothetical protein